MIDKNFDTYTKLVGVTKENDKGANIQDILPLLSEGGRLILIRDFGNPYDENAIKVYYHTKKESIHIGYLNRELAANLSEFLDENPTFDIDGIVDEITGGNGKTYGCNIQIWIQDPDEPSYDEIKAFQEHLKNQPKEKPPTADETILNDIYEDIYSRSEIHTPKTKFSLFRGFLVLIAILALVGFFGFASMVFRLSQNDIPTQNIKKISDSLITLNEYNMLHSGMSKTDVYAVVGSFGEKVSGTGSIGDDYHIEMYSYEGYGETGANAQLMFTNGELDTMAQFGLERYSSDWDIETVKNNISADDFEFNYTLPGVDILGYYDIAATCNNKSPYNIFSIRINAQFNNSTEEATIFCGDIIESGETSKIFDSIRHSSIPVTDYKILNYTVKIKSEEGNFYYFEYDLITGESKIY